MADDAVIPQERTAVPVEWDDFREQLRTAHRHAAADQPGGVSTLGAFINTAADNLRGEGAEHPRHRDQTVAGVLGAR